MKQVEVTILGQSYLLACPDDGQDALLQAVATVDREMSAIRDAGKVKARERMAVLAALNLAYRLAERDQNDQRNLTKPTPAASQDPGEETSDAASAARASRTMTEVDVAGLDLEGLMARLDEVLAEDGRLL